MEEIDFKGVNIGAS